MSFHLRFYITLIPALYLQIVWYCTKSTLYAINTSICNVYHENEYLNYHWTTTEYSTTLHFAALYSQMMS